MRRLLPLIAAALSTAASGSPPAPPPAPSTASRQVLWDDVPAPDRAFFERHATMLRRGPDGSVWSVKVAAELERLRPHSLGNERLSERFDQYTRTDAPVYYNLVTRERFQNENDAVLAIETTMREAQRRAREAKKRANLDQTPGAYITALKVHQVLPDGLLVSFPESDDRRQAFLTGFSLQRAVVDDDVLAVAMTVRPAGRHQFTSVMGAVRTIERYEVVREYEWDKLIPPDPPLCVNLEPLTGEDLFNLVQMGVVEEIPVWSLHRETVQRAVPSRTFRGLSGVQSGSYRGRTQGTPAVHRWHWEMETLPVPVYGAPPSKPEPGAPQPPPDAPG